MADWATKLALAIWTGHGSRWFLPLLLGLSTFCAFQWADSQLSPAFRDECAGFLKRRSYESYIRILPTLAVRAIDRLFGPKHASWKCARRSAIFSSCALLATFVVTAVFNPKGIFWLLQLAVQPWAERAWLDHCCMAYRMPHTRLPHAGENKVRDMGPSAGESLSWSDHTHRNYRFLRLPTGCS